MKLPHRRCAAARHGMAAAELVIALAMMLGIAAVALKFSIVVAFNLHQVIASIVGSPYL